MSGFVYIFKEMLAERTRLLLTVLAIAWGTAAITIMLAVGEGLRITYGNAMASAGKSILAVQGGRTSISYQGQSINQKITLNEQDLQAIKSAIPGIKITPEYLFVGQFIYQAKKMNWMISAVYPEFAGLRNLEAQPPGRFINTLDNQNWQKVIVLGNELTKLIFGDKIDPIGKYLLINNQPFLVIGVSKPKIQMWSYAMPDAFSAWIPAATYISLAHPTKINELIITPDNPDQLPTIKQQLLKIIAINHQLNPNDSNILVMQDSHEIQQKTNALFMGMEIFLGFVGLLTLIIAGVGIANVMFISIRRATREIGIRMAIGARTYQVLWHYLVQALFATLLGGFIGFIVAQIVVTTINAIPIHARILEFVGRPRPVISLPVFSLVVIILGLIGFFSGYFPARKAAAINPAEALRYE